MKWPRGRLRHAFLRLRTSKANLALCCPGVFRVFLAGLGVPLCWFRSKTLRSEMQNESEASTALKTGKRPRGLSCPIRCPGHLAAPGEAASAGEAGRAASNGGAGRAAAGGRRAGARAIQLFCLCVNICGSLSQQLTRDSSREFLGCVCKCLTLSYVV